MDSLAGIQGAFDYQLLKLNAFRNVMRGIKTVKSIFWHRSKVYGKGILEQIEESKSASEIFTLIRIGQSYKNVSNDTRRKWIKTARKRLALCD